MAVLQRLPSQHLEMSSFSGARKSYHWFSQDGELSHGQTECFPVPSGMKHRIASVEEFSLSHWIYRGRKIVDIG